MARRETREGSGARLYFNLSELLLLRALTRRTQLAKKVQEAIEKAEGK